MRRVGHVRAALDFAPSGTSANPGQPEVLGDQDTFFPGAALPHYLLQPLIRLLKINSRVLSSLLRQLMGVVVDCTWLVG